MERSLAYSIDSVPLLYLLALAAFSGLQISLAGLGSWDMGLKWGKCIYIHSWTSPNIWQGTVQIKKTSNAVSRGQAVIWKVSDEGETLVLQRKGKQGEVSSDWEPGIWINSANRCFQSQVIHVWKWNYNRCCFASLTDTTGSFPKYCWPSKHVRNRLR